MTDDLDRRIDARIARALRMMAEDSVHAVWPNYVMKVADALDPPEPELKPCPFCGNKPVRINEAIGCPNVSCPCENWFSVTAWNRRVEVPHG